MTQAQLADAIGTSQAAVAAYETGTKAPELAKLPAIAKALGGSVAKKAFEKLKPVEQQFVLKQIEGLIGQK
jgi:transcriptional regulator with XRE-family HTH domain